MDVEAVGIRNEVEAQEILEEQGLRLKDAQLAIAKALEGNWFLVHRSDENRFFTRCVNVFLKNLYVDYTRHPEGDFSINSAYAHKLELKRYAPGGYEPENLPGEETEWLCGTCAVAVVRVPNVQMTYDGIDFDPIEGWRCPQCGNELIPRDVYEEKLRQSEAMLEAK